MMEWNGRSERNGTAEWMEHMQRIGTTRQKLLNLVLFGQPLVYGWNTALGNFVLLAYAAARVLLGLVVLIAGIAILWRLRK